MGNIKRILPLKGNVHVKVGQNITSDTIVASTNLPGNVQMVKLSNILNIEPKDVEKTLKVKALTILNYTNKLIPKNLKIEN